MVIMLINKLKISVAGARNGSRLIYFFGKKIVVNLYLKSQKCFYCVGHTQSQLIVWILFLFLLKRFATLFSKMLLDRNLPTFNFS